MEILVNSRVDEFKPQGFRDWFKAYNETRSARYVFSALENIFQYSKTGSLQQFQHCMLEACFHATIWESQLEPDVVATRMNTDFQASAPAQIKALRSLQSHYRDNPNASWAGASAIFGMQEKYPDFVLRLGQRISVGEFFADFFFACEQGMREIEELPLCEATYMCLRWEAPRVLKQLKHRPSIQVALMFNLVHIIRQYSSGRLQRDVGVPMPQGGKPSIKLAAMVTLAVFDRRKASDPEIARLCNRFRTFVRNNPKVELDLWPTQ